jgi:hypothetical protein
MGSVAQDRNGNVAMGYSVSSKTVFPSIRFTGRRQSDPLGQMTMTEESIVQGAGSQTSSMNRWGEQSSMVLDPVDDYTFFYSNAYYETTSDSGWQTRITSFRLQDCTESSSSVSDGEVVVANVAAPIAAGNVSRNQDSSLGHDQVQGTSSGRVHGVSMVVMVVITAMLVATLFEMTSQTS